MKLVFVVQHVHEFEYDTDDIKMIGVYATREDALAAVSRLGTKPGFKETPDGFHISEYELGKDHWEQGYQSSERKPPASSGEDEFRKAEIL